MPIFVVKLYYFRKAGDSSAHDNGLKQGCALNASQNAFSSFPVLTFLVTEGRTYDPPTTLISRRQTTVFGDTWRSRYLLLVTRTRTSFKAAIKEEGSMVEVNCWWPTTVSTAKRPRA